MSTSTEPKTTGDMGKFEIQCNSMSDYALNKQVGSGTFATVFQTTHIPTGASYAFKQLVDLEDKMMKREIQIMKELADVPNMLPIRDIVKEVNPDGSVKAGLIVDYFKTENYKLMFAKLQKHEIKYFIYETLRTLSIAHSRGIAHRDIKPLNVLMSPERLEARVIDWGQSEYYLPNKPYSTGISTLYYKSPEMLMEFKNHDYALDIWATGCMLADMMFQKDHFFKAKKYSRLAGPEDSQETRAIKKLQYHKEHLDAIAQILGTLKLKQFADKFQDKVVLTQLDGIPDYKKVPSYQLHQ